MDLSAYYWDFIETLAHEENTGSLSEGSKLAMIEAGMDVDDEQDARHHASEAADDFISEMGDHPITLAELDAVIASEGSVNFCNYEGKTPLLEACAGYRWAISQHADAQLEDDDEDGREAKADAAAMLEARAHNLHTVLQRKPDMAARTPDGTDALGFAAESGSVDFVEQLLAHGAQVNEGRCWGRCKACRWAWCVGLPSTTRTWQGLICWFALAVPTAPCPASWRWCAIWSRNWAAT